MAARYRDVRYEHDGRAYAGTWHVEGDEVLISSAYGSRVEPVGKFKATPETVAMVAMGMIVGDYLKNGPP